MSVWLSLGVVLAVAAVVVVALPFLRRPGITAAEDRLGEPDELERRRLDLGAEWLRRLQTKYLRTGLSWADSFRPGAQNWFDSQMRTLEEFTVTLTLCFTPEHLGESKHHTSPPKCAQDFADFASWAVSRYASSPSPRTRDLAPVCEFPSNGVQSIPFIRY